MLRRDFLRSAGALLLPTATALPFQNEKSGLKITGVRVVQVKPKRPAPAYKPAAGSWSTGGVEVANPMSIYPEYKATRSLFMADKPEMGRLLGGNYNQQRHHGIGHRRAGGRLRSGEPLSEAVAGQGPVCD